MQVPQGCHPIGWLELLAEARDSAEVHVGMRCEVERTRRGGNDRLLACAASYDDEPSSGAVLLSPLCPPLAVAGLAEGRPLQSVLGAAEAALGLDLVMDIVDVEAKDGFPPKARVRVLVCVHDAVLATAGCAWNDRARRNRSSVAALALLLRDLERDPPPWVADVTFADGALDLPHLAGGPNPIPSSSQRRDTWPESPPLLTLVGVSRAVPAVDALMGRVESDRDDPSRSEHAASPGRGAFSLEACISSLPSHMIAMQDDGGALTGLGGAAPARTRRTGPSLLDMPPDVIRRIFELLATAGDAHRLGATCKALLHGEADAVPGLTRTVLYRHQRAALRWMQAREHRAGERLPHPTVRRLAVWSGGGGDGDASATELEHSYMYINTSTCEVESVVASKDEAAAWERAHAARDFGGGLFCDDPGLGKTVTAVALVLKTLGALPGSLPRATMRDTETLFWHPSDPDRLCGYYEEEDHAHLAAHRSPARTLLGRSPPVRSPPRGSRRRSARLTLVADPAAGRDPDRRVRSAPLPPRVPAPPCDDARAQKMSGRCAECEGCGTWRDLPAGLAERVAGPDAPENAPFWCMLLGDGACCESRFGGGAARDGDLGRYWDDVPGFFAPDGGPEELEERFEANVTHFRRMWGQFAARGLQEVARCLLAAIALGVPWIEDDRSSRRAAPRELNVRLLLDRVAREHGTSVRQQCEGAVAEFLTSVLHAERLRAKPVRRATAGAAGDASGSDAPATTQLQGGGAAASGPTAEDGDDDGEAAAPASPRTPTRRLPRLGVPHGIAAILAVDVGAAREAVARGPAVPPRRVHLSRATLVMVPDDLLALQWREQIERHVEPGRLRVLLYDHAVVLRTPAHEVAWDYDVVVATLRRASTEDPRSSVLQRIHWRRVLVDEGHVFNKSCATNMHQFTAGLRADLRWIMTGTPAPHTAQDVRSLAPLFRFADPPGPDGAGGHVAALVEASARPMAAGCWAARERFVRALERCVIRGSKREIVQLAVRRREVVLAFGRDHARSFNQLAEVIMRNMVLTDFFDPDHRESLLNPGNGALARQMFENLAKACVMAGGFEFVAPERHIGETLDLIARRLHRLGRATPGECPEVGALDDGAAEARHTVPSPSGDASERLCTWTSAQHPLHGVELALRCGGRCGCCGAAARFPLVTPCAHVLCVECAGGRDAAKRQRGGRAAVPPRDAARVRCGACGEPYAMQPVSDPERRRANPRPKWEVPLELIEWQPGYAQRGARGIDGGAWQARWEATRSSKATYLHRRLREVGALRRGGPKAVVFTQHWGHLQVLERHLAERCGVHLQVLSSKREKADREQAVRLFRTRPVYNVLLMDAVGAVGLDLHFARHVFLMEPIVDGALESQVVARAYRMGEGRGHGGTVHVEVLAMRGSSEEVLLAARRQVGVSRATEEAGFGEGARCGAEEDARQARRLFVMERLGLVPEDACDDDDGDGGAEREDEARVGPERAPSGVEEPHAVELERRPRVMFDV
ncbi:unnamed protein product [Pedinophyceae sp. YPF-701]|nr:unnamed protein product [Pedinophyceae sp. YPF-701]